MYSFKTVEHENKKRKGIKKSVVKKNIQHENCKQTQFDQQQTPLQMKTNRSSYSSNRVGLIPKTTGNRKRDGAWGCARGINTT